MVGVLRDVLPWLVSLLDPAQLMDSPLMAHLYPGHHDETTLIFVAPFESLLSPRTRYVS